MERHPASRQQLVSQNRHEGHALHTLLQGYELCARTEGKSPKTVRLTGSIVMILRDFLHAHGLPTDARRIRVPEIRQFIIFLQETPAYETHPHTRAHDRPLSGTTINTYLRALRAFFTWLVREGMIPRNPFFDMKLPKAPRKVVPTFSGDQIRSLLKVIDTGTWEGYRDRAMILLMLDTGTRLSEILNLTIADLDLEGGTFKVFGKGAKERIIPVGTQVRRALHEYITKYRPEPARLRYDMVFLNHARTPLGCSRVQVLIRHYGELAGIRGMRCSPHVFRHTFAITFLRNGGDVFSLQALLGHATLEMVRHYVNLAGTDVQAAHKKFSPADNMDLA
jgi:integrase/recombinase XerD